MARRQKIDVADFNDYDDYGDYGAEANYYQEDDEELAIKESNKQLKKEKKDKKKAKGVQDADVDALIELLGADNPLTRDQVKGTLENYKGDMEQSVEALLFKIS